VDLSPVSGMQAAGLLFDQAGAAIANMSAAPDVDLAAQVTQLITASIAYDANARVLQTQDELTRSTIDVVA
jgi:flagellar basal body rod protein FlgG